MPDVFTGFFFNKDDDDDDGDDDERVSKSGCHSSPQRGFFVSGCSFIPCPKFIVST